MGTWAARKGPQDSAHQLPVLYKYSKWSTSHEEEHCWCLMIIINEFLVHQIKVLLDFVGHKTPTQKITWGQF